MRSSAFPTFCLFPQKNTMQKSHQFYFFKVCRNLGCRKRVGATNSIPKTPLVLISNVLFPMFYAKNSSCFFAQRLSPFVPAGFGGEAAASEGL